MSYVNLEQRMVHAYLDLLPPFVPLEGGPAPVQSQEQFYRFMKSVYQAIFDAPALFFKKINEDDAYPNRFNRASYGKPKLYNAMKKDLKEIDELLEQLFAFGQNGAVEDGKLVISETVLVKKKVLNLLPHLGLELNGQVLSCARFDGLFPAWQWLASREHATVLSFSRCMFDPNFAYMQAVYAPLFGSPKAFERLVQYLETCRYPRFELKRGPYTLDYAKRTVPEAVALGVPMHGDPHHYGISADYRPDIAVPQYLVLRILEMKNLLLKFERMSPGLQKFILRYVKKCDDCGYCTQTDKTGKRKPLAIDITHEGASYRVCPLYPGFNFCFTSLDDGLVQDLTAFLDFMDGHLSSEFGAA